MRRFLVFSVFIMIFISNSAFAGNERPRIIIMPFSNGISENMKNLEDGLPDIITACFSSYSDNIEILERANLEKMSDEQIFNQVASQDKMGKLKGATHLLRGNITENGKEINIALLLYKLNSTVLSISADVSGKPDQLVDVACSTVNKLAGKFSSAKYAGGTNIEINRDEAKQDKIMLVGLGYYYNGLYSKAYPEFMKILKKDPKNFSAKYWLAKSYIEAGMKDYAKIESEEFIKLYPDEPKSTEIKNLLSKLDGEMQ